ncbi:PrgI family protein [Frankia sp. ArI3]|uniref:PrgI family protein n=1 Tax=Frankia sp. ArI3 TaxID=1858 RepID=UPI00272DF0A5|nr:PrgI family protein [Frankia sp. ArI3]
MSLSSAGDRTRIPADVDRPDQILAGLTARQLTVLVPPLLLAAAVFWVARPYLPMPVVILLCGPLVAVGVAVALGQRGGLPLDRYAAAALAHRRTPTVQTALPTGGQPAVPGWVPDVPGAHPAPVAARPLATGIDTAAGGGAGVVDLGDAVAVIAEVDATNITIATGQERAAKVTAFARMLNALHGPLQITVRTVPLDLTDYVDAMNEHARRHAHPALADVAAEQAAFLADLGRGRALRARQILLTARRPVPAGRGGRDAAAGQALRQLEDAAGLLATAGVGVRILDGAALGRLLAAAAHPDLPAPPEGVAASGVVRAAGAGR